MLDVIKEILMNKEKTYDQLFATSRDKMKEIMKEVFEKCKNDKIFERELLNNPTETIKKEGLELKPGVSIQIIKTEKEASLLPNNVIPLFLSDKQEPLSVEELDKVAGGVGEWGITAGFGGWRSTGLDKLNQDPMSNEWENGDRSGMPF
jgi:hypothetical protein